MNGTTASIAYHYIQITKTHLKIACDEKIVISAG